MPKFAHMSDLHIGAFRQQELRNLVLEAFEQAVDRCISEKVAFVILSGDIFDSNIPDLSSVRRAAKKMKQAVDHGIRFYVVYGSHDFSPNYSSMVDVLSGAGLFTLAEEMTGVGGIVRLSFLQDPSGPKLCGISGRKLSVDREEYAHLDKSELESEPGFKIFVFHGALEELKPAGLEMMEAMPASNLPSGFEYYAGGHVHSHRVADLQGRRNIAYPGPLFATDYSELLELARGRDRGFYIVEFGEEGISKIDRVPIKVCDVVELRYSAEGKTSRATSEELSSFVEGADVAGKVALLTVEGMLAEGRTSDIDFQSVKKKILASSPLILLSNYSHLKSKELAWESGAPRPRVTEREFFAKAILGVNSPEAKLNGDSGVEIALQLLQTLKEGKKENENKGEFEERTTRRGLAVLGLEGI